MPATTTKKAAKKSAKKVSPKKAASKAASENGAFYGIERDHDLRWNDKKVAIFKALKQLKAVGATSGRSAEEVAEKADVSARDVRHYCYHAKAAGLTGVAELEDTRGYSFYLTSKGAKVKPADKLKAQQADKK